MSRSALHCPSRWLGRGLRAPKRRCEPCPTPPCMLISLVGQGGTKEMTQLLFTLPASYIFDDANPCPTLCPASRNPSGSGSPGHGTWRVYETDEQTTGDKKPFETLQVPGRHQRDGHARSRVGLMLHLLSAVGHPGANSGVRHLKGMQVEIRQGCDHFFSAAVGAASNQRDEHAGRELDRVAIISLRSPLWCGGSTPGGKRCVRRPKR